MWPIVPGLEFCQLQLQRPSCEVRGNNRRQKDNSCCANPCCSISYGCPLQSLYPTLRLCELAARTRFPFSKRLDAMASSPPISRLGGGGRIGHGEMLQCDFCGILFRIVDVLAIVPESRRDVLALDCDCAGPSCPASSSIGHDLEHRRMNLRFPTLLL